MRHEVIKNPVKDKYFDIQIQNKIYPSCYQYNILVMLAKRLIKEDEQRVNACTSRNFLSRHFSERNC